jgi:hypothetical protein
MERLPTTRRSKSGPDAQLALISISLAALETTPLVAMREDGVFSHIWPEESPKGGEALARQRALPVGGGTSPCSLL